MSKIIKNGIVYGETLLPAAGNIAYDNTASGLNATTMQNAITELKDMYDLPKGYAWAGTQTEWDNLTVQEKAVYDGKIIAIIGDDSVPADDVVYDNTTSGMTATDAQAAIDELSAELGSLGDLAAADTASDTYTPAGTVTITSTASSIEGMATVGTLPTFTYDSTTKNLTYIDGTLPTKATVVSAMTGATASFTGTSAIITVEPDSE